MSFLFRKKIVQALYDPDHKDEVTIDDRHQAILARNPQLIKKE